MAAVLWYGRRRPLSVGRVEAFQPPATILKPVYGLETDLKARLRAACQQDYPDYQVVFCVQDPKDPALQVVKEIQEEFGEGLVSIALRDIRAGPNGKVNNLLGGLELAKHDVLVISDSDIQVRPDFLTAIVAPLADDRVGGVCTLFKNAGAERVYEKLELLTINADFIPSVLFAEVTGAAEFCLGPSVATRQSTLRDMGGLESFAEYLAEDYEIGRRIWTSGRKMVLVPYTVDAMLDLDGWSRWWTHQVYWDQNTRVANPAGFFGTILIKSVPFALLFAILRLGDPLGLAVLIGAIALRIATTAVILKSGLRDGEGLKSLWLLPLRDLAGLASWFFSYGQRTVIWRDVEYRLTTGGRMVAVASQIQQGPEAVPGTQPSPGSSREAA
jgi:ceramide glucosyltransferase